MGTELLASVAGAVATKDVLTTLLGSLVETGAKAAVKGVSEKLRRWNGKKGLDRLYERSKQLRKVKTLWQVEKELDLLRFYYPSKIKSRGEAPREVDRLSDFRFDGNLVVRGTVGQGKSIFLRYLAVRELSLGERVPVFVELRRLAASQSILNAVLEELKNLGLADADADLLAFLVQRRRLLLLLDGFDELAEAEVSRIVSELERLAVRWTELRMVVTSRPDTAIEHSPHFRIFDLAPLAPGEFANVVERIAHTPQLAEEIVAGVRRSHESIARLLTTPLMVTLLMLQYRVGQGIPENRVAFYEPLFMFLLQRHDKAKAGYVRARHSGLSDSELLQFFNCLCFVTRRDGATVLKHHDLVAAAARSVHWLSLSAKADHALDDIHRITCLLLHEGDEYRFLHKSVQEFHAACFVRDQPETLARDFYVGAQRRWFEWQQELLFLETIDPYRYNRHFAIPMLEHVASTLQGASPSQLGLALIQRLTARVALRPRAEFLNTTYPNDHVGWCLIQYFQGSPELLERIATAAVRRVNGAQRGSGRENLDVRELPLHDLLPDIGSDHPLLVAAAGELGTEIARSLETRRKTVHRVEERKGLLEI